MPLVRGPLVPLARLLVLPLVLLALAGCELPEWLGEAEGPPLPGERISILRLEEALTPDPAIADLQIRLPRPWQNHDWPQAAGLPAHAMYHLELAEQPAVAWRTSIGYGSSSELRLLAQPVVADGRVFTYDSEANAAAFSIDGGKRQWQRNLVPEGEEEGALGGGVAFSGGLLYVTTGYGFVYALDASTGEIRWQRRLGSPVRGAPTVAGGRVFAITYDNQTFALGSDDGRTLWQHSGIPEDAGVVGSPSAAVDGDVVVVPYTSGELFALRVENGRPLWSDQLVRQTSLTPLAKLSEITGSPVIDRDMVIAMSHSGRLAALDLRTGNRLWDSDIAGVETPWVAGGFIYLLTSNAELVCLERRSGRVRWVSQLQRYKDEEEKTGPILWAGPVLASDRLIVLSSTGAALAVSPYTGESLGQIELPDGARISPVVADGTLYILTRDAELLALR